ncbi:hypothetical protein ANN_05578 [Periplaneta americana]|uniref:HTH psq-type domain-containing protein n=1 Tax=Periplaneta americana TaxID=6978 RepID=A0ABQ8TC39_PERAM|nr:hypothetical protein ANN_05578 [Periplaneta americana]
MRVYEKVVGPTIKPNYKPEFLLNAVRAVQSGKLSIRKASEQYGVPYTTLNDKLKNKYKNKIGGQTALSSNEEKQFVEGVLCCAKWGFPLRNKDVRNIVQTYLNSKGRVEKIFQDNRPGLEWVRSFLNRNKELTVRIGENVKRARAAVSRSTVTDYFNNLEVSLNGVPHTNIINYDETNFCDDPGQEKVIVKRGTRHPERIVDYSKTSISVMIAAAADGTVLPPYTVYKAKHLYDTWTEGGTNANSTHLCQPLDVAFFRPLKSSWRSVLDDWKSKNRGVVPKSEFPRLLKGAFEKIGMNIQTNVVSGFRKAGIVPLCPNKVISQIPEEDTGDNNSEGSWTSAFEMQLKKARFVGSDDSDEDGKFGVSQNLVSISTLYDNEEEDEDDENDGEEKVKGKKKQNGREHNGSGIENGKRNEELNKNDFAIVKFPRKKRIRFFYW